MTKRTEYIASRPIVFDEVYYLVYAGGERELPRKDQERWNQTLILPEQLKIKEQQKLGMENNPKAIPITGEKVMMFVKELKFVPFFDKFFDRTHIIKLTDRAAYEYIRNNSNNNLDKYLKAK